MSNINDHYDGVYIRPYNYHDVQYLYCLYDTCSKLNLYFAWMALHHLHHMMVTGFGVEKDNVMTRMNVVNDIVYLNPTIWLTCIDSSGTDRFCAYSTQTYLFFVTVNSGNECYSFNRLLP